jgi:hypothetical protein
MVGAKAHLARVYNNIQTTNGTTCEKQSIAIKVCYDRGSILVRSANDAHEFPIFYNVSEVYFPFFSNLLKRFSLVHFLLLVFLE